MVVFVSENAGDFIMIKGRVLRELTHGSGVAILGSHHERCFRRTVDDIDVTSMGK